MFNDLGAGHTDTIVGNGNRLRFLLVRDANGKIGLILRERWLPQEAEAQPIDRIRGIRDQFAQKDVFVAIERMDHQVQQLLDFCLEPKRLFLEVLWHTKLSST